jgi:ribonuclease J
MKLLLHLTRPKFFIPVHGELKHLKHHVKLAEQVGIHSENILVLQNGQSAEFLNGTMKAGDSVPASYIFVDGSSVGDISPSIMREREMMSQEGVVIVQLTIDKQGRLMTKPNIISRGFLMSKDEEELKSLAQSKIQETVVHANGNLNKDVEKVVRNVLYTETRRRPLVLVNINEI